MRLDKVTIIVGCCICCAIGLAVAFSLEKQPNRSDFSLKSYSRITVLSGGNFTHAQKMDHILTGLRKGKRSVTQKPDHVLLLHSKSAKDPHFLSFFLADGFILDGNYLDAWTERMEGKESSVYLLSPEKTAEIKALFSAP